LQIGGWSGRRLAPADWRPPRRRRRSDGRVVARVAAADPRLLRGGPDRLRALPVCRGGRVARRCRCVVEDAACGADRIETDRKDAELLVRLLLAGSLTPVVVPSEACEAARDLARAREQVRANLARLRHRVSSCCCATAESTTARARARALADGRTLALLPRNRDPLRTRLAPRDRRLQALPAPRPACQLARSRARTAPIRRERDARLDHQDRIRLRAPDPSSRPPGTTCASRGSAPTSATATPVSTRTSSRSPGERSTASTDSTSGYANAARPATSPPSPPPASSPASSGRQH
jgi:hypothetical protein